MANENEVDPLAGVDAGTSTVDDNSTGEGKSESEVTQEAIAEVLAADKTKDAKEIEESDKDTKEPKTEEADKEPKTEEADKAEADKDKEEKPKPEDEAKAAKEAKEAKEKEDKTAKEKADLVVAERMSKLAAQERKLLGEKNEIKKERDAISKEREEHTKLKEAIALLEINPSRAIKLLGKDFNKMASRALDLAKNPSLALEDEMQAQRSYLEGELSKERKAREESEKRYREEAASQAKELDRRNTFAYIRDQIRSGGEKFELIQAEGLEDKLAGEMWEHFEQTGEVVNLEEFLSHAEKELEEKIEKKILTAGKIKKKLVGKLTAANVKAKEEAAKPAPVVEAEDDKETEDEAHDKTVKRIKRTLSNGVTTRPAPVPVVKKESSGDIWQDAKEEALAFMEAEEAKSRRA